MSRIIMIKIAAAPHTATMTISVTPNELGLSIMLMVAGTVELNTPSEAVTSTTNVVPTLSMRVLSTNVISPLSRIENRPCASMSE